MSKEIAPKKKPLENFFDLPVTTEDQKEDEKKDLVVAPEYDEKDDDLDRMYEDIQKRAITAHETMMDEAEEIEGRSKARFYEVANAILGTSLAALEKRARLKEHKDKLQGKAQKDTSTTKITNQSITINTTDLIKQLKGNVIEGEIVSDSGSQDKKE